MVFTLETRQSESGLTVIELAGSITLGQERGKIEAAVLKALSEGAQKLVFDLSKVSYIDSTGIGIIAYCYGKVSQKGGQAAVAGAKGRVLEVFHLTGLQGVIPFFADVAAACDGLATARPSA